MISEEVLESFYVIKQSFQDTDQRIMEERTMMEYINNTFSQIKSQIAHISDIAGIHSTATEEMLAATEEQTANIETIYDSIRSIQNSSIRLQKLTEMED